MYLWCIENNKYTKFPSKKTVVICSQKCIFDVLKTTGSFLRGWYVGCDLLSKMYLWCIENNSICCMPRCWLVVICSQKCIFDVLKTTVVVCVPSWLGCDLLSKMYLWCIENNHIVAIQLCRCVVICSQKCIFDVLKTTCCI